MSPKKVKRGPMVACPTCNMENPMGSVFCISCGERLYKDGATAKVINADRVGGPAKAILNAIRAVVLLALCAVLALLIWPQSLPEFSADPGDLAVGERTLATLSRQARAQKLEQVVFTEGNLNAMLGEQGAKAAEDPNWGSYKQRSPSDARIVFDPDNAGTLTFRDRWGALPLSVRVEFTIDPEEKSFTVTRLWHGHLPLPVKFAPNILKPTAERFGLKNHLDLLRSIRPLASRKHAIAVETRMGVKLLPQENVSDAR